MLSLTHLAGGASRPRARARAALLRHGVFVLFFVEKGGEKEGKKIVFLCFVSDVELQSLSLLDVDDRATAKPIYRKKNPFFFFLNLSLPTAPAALGGSRSHGDPRSVRKNKERMRERENERERDTHGKIDERRLDRCFPLSFFFVTSTSFDLLQPPPHPPTHASQ